MAAAESFVLLTEIRLSSIIILFFYICFDYVVSYIAQLILVVYSSSFYSHGHDHSVEICTCTFERVFVCVGAKNE